MAIGNIRRFSGCRKTGDRAMGYEHFVIGDISAPRRPVTVIKGIE
jgi:hypothetical protein